MLTSWLPATPYTHDKNKSHNRRFSINSPEQPLTRTFLGRPAEKHFGFQFHLHQLEFTLSEQEPKDI